MARVKRNSFLLKLNYVKTSGLTSYSHITLIEPCHGAKISSLWSLKLLSSLETLLCKAQQLEIREICPFSKVWPKMYNLNIFKTLIRVRSSSATCTQETIQSNTLY